LFWAGGCFVVWTWLKCVLAGGYFSVAQLGPLSWFLSFVGMDLPSLTLGPGLLLTPHLLADCLGGSASLCPGCLDIWALLTLGTVCAACRLSPWLLEFWELCSRGHTTSSLYAHCATPCAPSSSLILCLTGPTACAPLGPPACPVVQAEMEEDAGSPKPHCSGVQLCADCSL
jgi:hypothetical protein